MPSRHRAVFFPSTLVTLGLFFFANGASAAWTEPTQAPPGGNVAAPLNVSGTAQIKTGGLTVQGGLETYAPGVTPPEFLGIQRGHQATAEPTTDSTFTAGIFGVGGNATGGGLSDGWSAGVYGVSYPSADGTQFQIGLLGVAGTDHALSVGVFGWDGEAAEGASSNAYAGYFRGKVKVAGTLSATKFCFDPDNEATCVSGSWPGGAGGDSLLTETPENNTYLEDTTSNFAVGGTGSLDEPNTSFYFDVSGATPTFFAKGQIVVGPPPASGFAGDSICSPGETCSNPDCWSSRGSCSAGFVCRDGATEDDDCVPIPEVVPPSTPQNLRLNGAATQTTIPLAWNASTDTGGSGLDTYIVYRCVGSGCTPVPHIITGTTAVTFVDSVSAGTTYVYQVTARDGAGNESALSNSLEAASSAADDTQPPNVPADFAPITPHACGAYASWTAPSDNPAGGGTGIAGYKMYRCQGASCSPLTFYYDTDNPEFPDPPQEWFEDYGVTIGQTYRYQISAYDGAGNESGRTGILNATIVGCGGGSPIMAKPSTEGSRRTPVEGIAKVSGVKPLSKLFAPIKANAEFRPFTAPEAQAYAGNFISGEVRFAVNQGILQLIDADGDVRLEIGNPSANDTDFASAGNINLLPGKDTTGDPNDGNVGIGTATPLERLDVVGNIAFSGTLTNGTVPTERLVVTNCGPGNVLQGIGGGIAPICVPAAVGGAGVASIIGGLGITASGTDDITLDIVPGIGITVAGDNVALTNTGVTAGPVGTTAAKTVTVDVDAQGRLTTASERDISIDASQITAGILPFSRGGTNATLVAVNGGIAYSNASRLALSAAGGAGQLLASGGAGTPVWQNITTRLTSGANIAAIAPGITATIATVQNPSFTTSVTTPQLLSLGADLTLDAAAGFVTRILDNVSIPSGTLTVAGNASFSGAAGILVENRLDLPAGSRTTLPNYIDGGSGNTTSRYIFGGDSDGVGGNDYRLSFLSDNGTTPILSISDERRVRVGQAGATAELCLNDDCKTAWPAGGGGLPVGTDAQTLRYNGATLEATSFLLNTGSAIGINASTPLTSALDLNGAFTIRGIAAPGASPAGQGRVYFDSTANKLKVSQNGGTYVDLVKYGDAPVATSLLYGTAGDVPWRSTAVAEGPSMRTVYQPFGGSMTSVCPTGVTPQYRLYMEEVDNAVGARNLNVKIDFIADDTDITPFFVSGGGASPSYRTYISPLFPYVFTGGLDDATIEAWWTGSSGPYFEIRKLELRAYCL